MPSIKDKITGYMANLSPSVLGLENKAPVEILAMAPGSYNLNFHVRVGSNDFIFRVNIEPQSGLDAQIEHEFKVLKFLDGHGIAPRAFHYDDSRRYFEYDILIEEYLAGPVLSLEADYLPDVAELLARLHSLDPAGMPFMIWQDPLADTHELIRGDLAGYEAVKNPDKKTISLAREVLSTSGQQLSKRRHLFQAERLNHTDLCCENFIITAEGLRLIDWEKPRVDDVSYDLGCFLSEPAQLYNSRTVLNSEQREGVIEAYAGLSGKSADLLMEKVNVREPMISLHWILWAATKLANLSDQRTSPELVKAHEEKVARYQRVANPQNIERLIERCSLY